MSECTVELSDAGLNGITHVKILLLFFHSPLRSWNESEAASSF